MQLDPVRLAHATLRHSADSHLCWSQLCNHCHLGRKQRADLRTSRLVWKPLEGVTLAPASSFLPLLELCLPLDLDAKVQTSKVPVKSYFKEANSDW